MLELHIQFFISEKRGSFNQPQSKEDSKLVSCDHSGFVHVVWEAIREMSTYIGILYHFNGSNVLLFAMVHIFSE